MTRIRESLYALLACSLAVVTFQLQAEDNEINWLGSYSDALAQARRENKPIFIEFRCEA